jgi:hypothetical protein
LAAGKCANVAQFAFDQNGGYSVGFNEAGPIGTNHAGSNGIIHYGPDESATQTEIFLKYADVYVGKPKDAVYWNREATDAFILPFNTSIKHFDTISWQTYSSMKEAAGIDNTGRTNLANGIKLHMQNELTYAYNGMYNNKGKTLVIKYFYYV